MDSAKIEKNQANENELKRWKYVWWTKPYEWINKAISWLKFKW